MTDPHARPFGGKRLDRNLQPKDLPMLTTYYPEMKEARPAAEIDAQLGHYGKHYFIKTRLTLAGRGIEFLGQIKPGESCGPRAAELVGMNQYKVTIAAFEKLMQRHSASSAAML